MNEWHDQLVSRMVSIQASLNGVRPPGTHPQLPITADELASDAAAVRAVGATSVVVHVRDHAGAETLDPELVDEAVRQIRRRSPDLSIGVAVTSRAEPDTSRRAELVERWTEPAFAVVRVSEPGAALVIGALLDAGTAVVASVADPADVRRLDRSGTGDELVRVIVAPDGATDDQATLAWAVERALDAAAIRAPRLHHGSGPATWDVLRAAVARGRDLQVGLADTLVDIDGRPARSNRALVRSARRLAEPGD